MDLSKLTDTKELFNFIISDDFKKMELEELSMERLGEDHNHYKIVFKDKNLTEMSFCSQDNAITIDKAMRSNKDIFIKNDKYIGKICDYFKRHWGELSDISKESTWIKLQKAITESKGK